MVREGIRRRFGAQFRLSGGHPGGEWGRAANFLFTFTSWPLVESHMKLKPNWPMRRTQGNMASLTRSLDPTQPPNSPLLTGGHLVPLPGPPDFSFNRGKKNSGAREREADRYLLSVHHWRRCNYIKAGEQQLRAVLARGSAQSAVARLQQT